MQLNRMEKMRGSNMDFQNVIYQRRSYRGKYLPAPVPREELIQILEAGMAAPSGCNKQTTSFVAVDDPAVLDRVKAVIDPPIAQTAPAAICVLTQRVNAYRDRCFAVQDYSAAIENMLLTITALGYASCWYEGHITDEDRICDKIAEILHVPQEYDLVAFLPVGIAESEPAAPKKRPFEARAWFNSFPGAAHLAPYREEDYEAVCTFLHALNRGDPLHMDWNWARWEWMYHHDEMDRTLLEKIGLWWAGDTVVGAAIYDMYPGEGCALWLPGYQDLAEEILDYAANSLRDESGFAMEVNVRDMRLKHLLKAKGWEQVEQTEHILRCDLNLLPHVPIPKGYTLRELGPEDGAAMQWLMWQGFDHGADRAACEQESSPVRFRAHQRKELTLALQNEAGEDAALCGIWYLDGTDYAYVEPVCVVPQYRTHGLGRALLTEALSRAHALGAKYAYVLSDMDFYRTVGFKDCERYKFWRKS